MKSIATVLIVISVIGLGAFLVYKKTSQDSNYSQMSALITPVPTDQQKSYTLSDISNHNTESDCWMAIDGGVFDVTKYISSHPGGKMIVQGCGKDATEMFHNRPDREPDHSTDAVAMLQNMKIGTLTN